MQVNVQQRTNQWHELRASRIGSSEIFGLIKYYISENELQNIGINPDSFTENPYLTAFELYHKFKNPAFFIGNQIKRENELFGRKIEALAFEVLRANPSYNSQYRKGTVYAEENTIASLDIEATAGSGEIIFDINGFPINLAEEPNYLIEIKGIYDSIDPDKPLDWRHVFQTQFAMKKSGKTWGEIFAVSLINDNQFERGYVSSMPKNRAIAYLLENTQINRYTIKIREDYQVIINLALDRFFSDVRSGNEPLPDEVKNAEMVYNIVCQKAELLGTEKDVLESPAANKYIKIKKMIERGEQELKNIKKEVLAEMISTGKIKAISDKGHHLSLNKNSLRITEKKQKEGNADV